MLTWAELPTWYAVTVAFVFGLTVGSFLNVVIYRLPRGLDIVRPRSRCPSCGGLIPWYRNVPVLSWLLLWGRCADCGEPISARYPLVELAVAAAFGASMWRWGVTWSALVSAVFATAMLALALIDLDHRILPNAITLPGIVAGFLSSLVNPRVDWVDSAIGIIAGGGILYGVAWAYLRLRDKEGMGMGDVKLIAMIGAFLGWQGALLTIFLGSLLGSVVGVAGMAVKGNDWDYQLPFGTFLAAAAVAVDWVGRELLDWYLGFFTF